MAREIKFRAWHLDDGMLYFDLDSFAKDYHNQYGNIMQYTGLKDNNGKEIYEGDVLRYWGDAGHIIFFEPNAAFMIQTSNDLHAFYGRETEVIGNIYENPELINP